MSENNIPFHIQEEIIKRLPVKSLIRFRSVSKAWKYLINNPQFIADLSLHSHTQPRHHLLVSYQNQEKELNFVCFEDDDTIPQQLASPNIVGISHGLVGFYCPDDKLAVIWNPSIRKSIDVAVRKTPYVGQRFVGFGVCPVTTDPKIIAITQSWDRSNTRYQCEVMVYNLSSGNWRRLSTNLPAKPIHEWYSAVAAGGFIYWLAKLASDNMIISFDVTNETFQMIGLPDRLARQKPLYLQIHKLRESLSILQYDGSTRTVWMMEGGVQRSFTKLFNIQAPAYSLAGFRKSGVPILKVFDDGTRNLVVYEPNSEHNNFFDIPGDPFFSKVYSYMETLLLLGRSDSSSY